MIIPQSRLLFWVSVLVLPFATLAGVYDPAALISLVLIGVFVLVVLVDAVLGLKALDAFTLRTAPVIRASKDRPANLELFVTNQSGWIRHLRIGFGVPSSIQMQREIFDLAIPDSEWSKVDCGFVGRVRGNFPLRRAYVEGPSPFGFWALRRSLPLDSEVRIYPNLLQDRNSLAALFLNRGLGGVHRQRQIGKGREFEKLREYVPGDGFDEVHWKATARRGRPITKVFQIERTQEVYVILDASRLSGRPAGAAESAVPILERYITAALVLGLAAERQGDLFGLVAFSDKIESFVRARNGKAHYHACRDAIYALQPKTVTPDFDELASFIRLRLRRRALLLVLTDLNDPVLAESFVRNADLLRRQHLVLVNMIKPAGADPLFSHPDVQTEDDLYHELGGHLQWHNLRELQKVLQRRGVDFTLLENERLSVDLVTEYLNVKQRQLL
jgi:uncharacterized protein (DUF58 family)